MPTVETFKRLANDFITKTFSEFAVDFTVESFVETPDGQGGLTVVWSEFASLTGFVKTDNASEITLDDHIESLHIKKFSFEFMSGITTKMRLVYLGDLYNIHSVSSIEDSSVWSVLKASRDVAT